MNEQKKTITREELYEQLWKVPISRLTIGLGYSYTELVKICAELKIPRPTGGYWYRLQHGGHPEKVPLPPASEGMRLEIPLGPRLSTSGEQLATPAFAREPTEGGVPSVETGKDSASVVTAAENDIESERGSDPNPTNASAAVQVAPKFPDFVEMTREELYEHVWSTPIHLLAHALGLSDVGLAKTCAHLEIPRPGRGYWARLDAGERVEKLKLPPRSEHTPRACEFNVAANRKRRAEWAAGNLTAKSKGYSVAPIALPEEQQALHEVAERHREAMDRAKRDEHGFIHLDVHSLFRCSISLTMAPKLVRAISALAREFEKRNCQFVRGDKVSPNLQIGRGKERLTVRWHEDHGNLRKRKATGRIMVAVSAIGLRGQRSWTEGENKMSSLAFASLRSFGSRSNSSRDCGCV